MNTKTTGRTDRCTQRIVDQKGTIATNGSTSASGKPVAREHRRSDKKTGTGIFRDEFGDVDDGDDSSSLFWECIPNIDHDPFELCSAEDILRSRDEARPSGGVFDNSVSIRLSDSSSDRPTVSGDIGNAT